MDMQAGFDHVAFALPVEIERWHGGRHVQRAAAPPDVLIIDEQSRRDAERRRNRDRKGPFRTRPDCVAGGDPALFDDRPPKIDLEAFPGKTNSGLSVAEQVRRGEEADPQLSRCHRIIHRAKDMTARIAEKIDAGNHTCEPRISPGQPIVSEVEAAPPPPVNVSK